MLDLIREIGQTLRNNRTRTALTGFAVAWGIFMLILLLGVSRGVYNSFQANMGESINNELLVWGGVTSKPYKGYKDGRRVQLKTGDIDKIIQSNGGTVESVTPFASNDTARISTGRDVVSGGFQAVYPDVLKSDGVELLAGRFINGHDIDARRRSLVLCARDARMLFGDVDGAIGSTVSSMGLAWTVVGVYEHRWRTQSYVPYTTFVALNGGSDNVNQLNVRVCNISTISEGEKVEADVRATLGHVHDFAPDDNSAVYTWNKFTGFLRGSTAMNILDWVMWIIGIFTLLSGIVGVSNIMFVSVRERIHEIGIRRAIGAKPRSILLQVMTESIAITTLFGYAGIVMGMVVLQVVDAVIGDVEGFKDPTVDLSMAVKVTLALIVAGSLAGLFPALKATKVRPVEALSEE